MGKGRGIERSCPETEKLARDWNSVDKAGHITSEESAAIHAP